MPWRASEPPTKDVLAQTPGLFNLTEVKGRGPDRPQTLRREVKPLSQ